MCLLQPPDCAGVCHDGLCVDKQEELNGINDDCALDDAVDEDFDLDHDGVCSDPEVCPTEAVDVCPTVWNPYNDPALCPDPDPDDYKGVALILSVPGATGPGSSHRRTNEPMEVPLRNGFVDGSVEGYWKLDHGMARDHSGKSRNGVVFGTPVPAEDRFGLPGGALGFENGHVEVPDTLDALNPTWAMTVTAWFKPDSIPVESVGVVEKWGDGEMPNRSWRVWLEPDAAEVRFSVSGDGVNEAMTAAGLDLESGQWTHVAGVFNQGHMALYLNGRLVSATAPGVAPSKVFDSSGLTRMRIGHSFSGYIDEVAVFSRGLGPGEVEAYALSNMPYGSALLPGSQPDYDDLRIIEIAPQQSEHEIPLEVVGIRPHSDSACKEEDDGTLADREDLCGVVAYWKLDGDGQDASGNGYHIPEAASKTFGPGRFGDGEGALELGPGVKVQLEVEKVDLHLPTFTLESWVHCPSVGWSSIMGKSGTNNSNINYQLYISQNGFPACRFHREGEAGAPVECVAEAPTVPVGRWTHLACTYDQDHIRVYVDGMEVDACEEGAEPTVAGKTVFIGGPPALCRFDEVLIHGTAKSPGYLLRRVHEGVPVVRFLAQTDAFHGEDGAYGFLDYTLRWGQKSGAQDMEAHFPILKHPDGTRCYGLLTPCLGYEGWWEFDEGAGTVVRDTGSNGFHGTLEGNGNAPWWTVGAEGSGLLFDGEHGYVDIPNGIEAEAATLDAWVSYSSDFPNTLGTIVESWKTSSTAGSGFSIAYVPTAELRFNVGGKEADTDPAEDPIKVPVGTEDAADLPVALTYDNQEGLTTWVGYKAATQPALLENRTPYSGDQTVYVGKNTRLDGKNFHAGTIDSVRIMNRVLTNDEFLHHPLAAWEVAVCTTIDGTEDPDCDGAVGPDDCAPLDPAVQTPPAQEETCGVDHDCDGLLVDAGEGCDDENDMDWDGCNDCQIAEYSATVAAQGHQSTIGQNRSLITFPDGRYLVAWSSPDLGKEPDQAGWTMNGDDGDAVDMTLEKPIDSKYLQPTATLFKNGQYMIVWTADSDTENGLDVVGQRYEEDGTHVAVQFVWNTQVSGNQVGPSTAPLFNGYALVAWSSLVEEGTEWRIMARLRSAWPYVLGTDFHVSPTVEGDQTRPSVASTSESQFTVVWVNAADGGSKSTVMGQRFKTDMFMKVVAEGDPFIVDVPSGMDQDRPAIAALLDGSTVIAWEEWDDISGKSAIHIRRFAPDGMPASEPIAVSPGDGSSHIRPSLSTAKDGSLVVAWERKLDGDSNVLAQRIGADGQPVGAAIPVNLFTAGFQGAPSVAVYGDGHFRVVWTSEDQDGDGLGVFTQRFDPFGNKVFR